jgi:hypothetical protein
MAIIFFAKSLVVSKNLIFFASPKLKRLELNEVEGILAKNPEKIW